MRCPQCGGQQAYKQLDGQEYIYIVNCPECGFKCLLKFYKLHLKQYEQQTKSQTESKVGQETTNSVGPDAPRSDLSNS